jgi:hypothetical protein
MNVEQILNMILRTVMRRGINSAMNAGFKGLSRTSRGDEQRRQQEGSADPERNNDRQN